jgi:RNA polymerase sigma factor (sigma-70 family)
LEDERSPVPRLVASAIAGDERAWNELVDRYAPLVMSVVARYRLSTADAQDVSQIVWLRLVEHLAELREPHALPRWLITTTGNECVRLLRAVRRTEVVDPSTWTRADDADRTGVDQAMLSAERREALLQALAELPDHQRRLLLLMVEDPPLSYADISARLGVPLGSIGPTRARAMQRLRSAPALQALREVGQEPGCRGCGQHDATAMAGR